MIQVDQLRILGRHFVQDFPNLGLDLVLLRQQIHLSLFELIFELLIIDVLLLNFLQLPLSLLYLSPLNIYVVEKSTLVVFMVSVQVWIQRGHKRVWITLSVLTIKECRTTLLILDLGESEDPIHFLFSLLKYLRLPVLL